MGDGNHGASIASRWPIGEVREANLHLDAPDGRLPLRHARRGDPRAGALGARHVVVGGDFNADPRASSVVFWRDERSLEGASVCYWDAWERARPGEAGHTFTPRNPLVSENKPAPGRGRMMDYLLLRCEDSLYGPTLEVCSCELAFDEPVDEV